jgi:hypothetical protein
MLVLKTGEAAIDLLNPTPEQVNIDDMLHNLSRIPRWCGAGKLSVLQHMMLVSLSLHDAGESRVTVLAGLTHDLHEYATGDIPAPLLTGLMYDDGVALHRVTDMQRHIQVAIQARLGIDLTGADIDAVQRADEQARRWDTIDPLELSTAARAIASDAADQAILKYRRGLKQLGVEI